MKGALGNALIMNIVITFIIIFFSLLIGSMAYSKAYKTKNYLINMIDRYENEGLSDFSIRGTEESDKWDTEVNEYLKNVGYQINGSTNTCKHMDGYQLARDNKNSYNYCIYVNYNITGADQNPIVETRYNYMVLVYMQFDIPVLGNYFKVPIKGETKSYTIFR